MKDLAKKLDVSDRIVFCGAITDDEKLKEYFYKAFAYVSPGPVGLGVLHSFAYGVPVVTNYIGKHGPEYDNLVHNENALLYHLPNELEKILIDLSNNTGISKELGQNAYKFYSNDRSISKMIDGFKEAIDSCKKRK